MKMHTAAIWMGLLISGSAFGETSMKSMRCWDHTFSYNQLSIRSNGDQLNFASSGQDLFIYRGLIKLEKDQDWGNLKASFSIPRANCEEAATDPRMLICQLETLAIEVRGRVGLGEEIRKNVTIKQASVKIRKVEEATTWDRKTSIGYELSISTQGVPTRHLLNQRYFHGLGGDHTSNCELE